MAIASGCSRPTSRSTRRTRHWTTTSSRTCCTARQRPLELKELHTSRRLFRGIKAFQDSIDAVENELIALDALPGGDFKDAAREYYSMLDNYRFMSFGTQIVHAVSALEDPEIHTKVTAGLRHLIVDEYQDVNPAQEQLVSLLAKPVGTADLVVVGDDDQAIYQWRGSNVSNIVTFAARYDEVASYRLLVNRRSRPDIVALANGFAGTISGRLDKEMAASRPVAGPSISIAIGHEDEQTEADASPLDIEALHARECGTGTSRSSCADGPPTPGSSTRSMSTESRFSQEVAPASSSSRRRRSSARRSRGCPMWTGRQGASSSARRSSSATLLDDYRETFGLSDDDVQAVQRAPDRSGSTRLATRTGTSASCASSTPSPNCCTSTAGT